MPSKSRFDKRSNPRYAKNISNPMNAPPPSLSFHASSHPGNTRLDKWLAEQMPDVSRTRIQEWIRRERVRVNGKPASPGASLPPDAVVEVDPTPLPKQAPAAPGPGPLDILHEDDHLIVVNKPPALVVHPAPGHPAETLVNRILTRCPDLADVGDPLRPGVVHRLDADTSGVIVFARTGTALRNLQGQFRSRETRKEYLALCHGVPHPVNQTLDAPIGRHPVHRKKRAVHGEGARDALTFLRVEKGVANGGGALLRLRIETGRTHQIRVHLAHAGHPVLGDRVYGGKRAQLPSPAPRAPRQMLHAASLELRHPSTGAAIRFEAPLATDMKTYMDALS